MTTPTTHIPQPDANGEFKSPADGAKYMALQHGIPQVPLQGKNPAIGGLNWQTKASLDPNQIDVWEKEIPGCNFGSLAEGRPGASCVLEVDAPNVRQRYKEETGKDFTDSLFVKSRKGGHRWYKQTAATIAIGNISQKIAKDFSLRSDNQMCVSPGSVHPESGEQYSVISNAPIVEMSETMLKWFAKYKEAKAAVTTVDDDAPIPDGQRNDSLASIAGKCRNAGQNYEEILSHLSRVNQERCTPPMSDNEVEKIAASYARYPAGHPENEVAFVGSSRQPASDPDITKWRDYFRSKSQLDSRGLVYLIDGFLPEGTTFIGALPGEGKTLLALSIAKALVTGKPFLGKFAVPKPVPVLYLIPESGGGVFRQRLESFQIPDGETFLCRTLSEGPTLGLDNPILIEAVKQMGNPLVVLDTLVRFNEADDENSAAQNRVLMEGIINLRMAGACGVLAPHHSPKSLRDKGVSQETALRGTGDIAASADAIYAMLRDDKLYDFGNGVMEVDIIGVKARDFTPPIPFRIAASRKTLTVDGGLAVSATVKAGMTSIIDSTGDFLLKSFDVVIADKEAAIKELVADNPSITLKDLAKSVSLSESRISRIIEKLGFRKDKSLGCWIKKKAEKGGADSDVRLES
jgi:hypothetical protein